MCFGGGGGSKSQRLPPPPEIDPTIPVTSNEKFDVKPPKTTGTPKTASSNVMTGLTIPTGT